MYQSDLQAFLIEKLNLNTKNLTYSGEYFYGTDSGKFVITQQDGYKVNEIPYLPTQIVEWNITPEPFLRIDKQDFAVPLRIACREEQLDDCFVAIEEFRALLNGTEQDVNGVRTAFRIAQPNPPVSPVQESGFNWILIDVTIMGSASDGLIYGNNPLRTIQLRKSGETYETVVVTDMSITTTTDTNTSQVNGEVSISNNKRTLSVTMTIMFESNVDFCDELLNWLWIDLDMNTEFDMILIYSGIKTVSETFRISNIQQALQFGVPVGFTVTFYRST